MVIAVPYENEKVFTPFDKAKQFKFYEVIGRRVTDMMVVDTEETGPYAIMRFLKQFSTDIMLCESIEEEPLLILDDNGIMVYRNVKGEIDQAVFEFLFKNLAYEHNDIYANKEKHDHTNGCSCGHDHTHGENCTCDSCKGDDHSNDCGCDKCKTK